MDPTAKIVATHLMIPLIHMTAKPYVKACFLKQVNGDKVLMPIKKSHPLTLEKKSTRAYDNGYIIEPHNELVGVVKEIKQVLRER